MPDLQKLLQDKEKILNAIKNSGPSFPTRIARETSIQPLFAAAFLSELVAERKLRVSSMKVGSSPIYYIQGQENNLEKFAEYLTGKEREAYFIIKESKILEDEKQDPAIRVAIRKLKDFAVPLNAQMNGNTKLFWKFFNIPDIETKELIEKALGIKSHEEKTEKVPEKITDKKERLIEENKEKQQNIFDKESRDLKKSKKIKTSSFTNKVKAYLEKKGSEIKEETEKNREYNAKISINTNFGKQEYFLTAKEKKKINEDDLAIAIHKAQHNKMPALFLSSGDMDKTGEEFIKNWQNLIKFQKI